MSSPGVDPRTNRNVRQGVKDPSAAAADPAQKTKEDYSGIDSLGSLLDSVPELSTLVSEAIDQGWTPAKFQNAVQDSDWWKTHSATARQVIIQRANDPKSFKQSLNNTTSAVTAMAHQMGFSVDGATLRAIANSALLTGNDTNQGWLQQQLGRHVDYSKVKNTGSLKGQMAATASQLQQQAAQYGMNWTAAQVAQRAQQVVQGSTTIDTYTAQLKQWAKSAFPALAKDIDAGQTVQQLADPYVQSMSQLLEVDPGTLNLYTPSIRRALQGVQDPKTKERQVMNLSDFEDHVRQDPRWQYTQNAKDTMSTALLKMGADFGFGPGA
jgi:hypothetical protein